MCPTTYKKNLGTTQFNNVVLTEVYASIKKLKFGKQIKTP